MGYEALIETLLKEGENHGKEVRDRARTESEAILQQSRERVEELKRAKARERAAELASEKAKIINQARLEARHLLLKTKHEVMQQVLAGAENRLKEWIRPGNSQRKRRPFWNALVSESLPEPWPSGIKVAIHESAPAELEAIFTERGIPCDRVKDPELWYGYRIFIPEGNVVLTNSYRIRLEMVLPELLVELHALLFGTRHEP